MHDTVANVSRNSTIAYFSGGIEPAFGPLYPALAGANKWRKLSRKRDLTHAETCEYGESVLESVRRLQAQELQRVVESVPARATSGTFHNDGETILAALRGKIAADCARRPAWDGASNARLKRLYAEAMRRKVGRLAHF